MKTKYVEPSGYFNKDMKKAFEDGAKKKPVNKAKSATKKKSK